MKIEENHSTPVRIPSIEHTPPSSEERVSIASSAGSSYGTDGSHPLRDTTTNTLDETARRLDAVVKANKSRSGSRTPSAASRSSQRSIGDGSMNERLLGVDLFEQDLSGCDGIEEEKVAAKGVVVEKKYKQEPVRKAEGIFSRVIRGVCEKCDNPYVKGAALAFTTAAATTAGILVGATSLPFLGSMAAVGFTFQAAIGQPGKEKEEKLQLRTVEGDIEAGEFAPTPVPPQEMQEAMAVNALPRDEEEGGIGRLVTPEKQSGVLVKAWKKCVQEPVHYLEEKYRFPIHYGTYVVIINAPVAGTAAAVTLTGMWGYALLEQLAEKVREKVVFIDQGDFNEEDKKSFSKRISDLVKKHPFYTISGGVAATGVVLLNATPVNTILTTATSSMVTNYVNQVAFMAIMRPIGHSISDRYCVLKQKLSLSNSKLAKVLNNLGFLVENPAILAAGAGVAYAFNENPALRLASAATIGSSQGMDKRMHFVSQNIMEDLQKIKMEEARKDVLTEGKTTKWQTFGKVVDKYNLKTISILGFGVANFILGAGDQPVATAILYAGGVSLYHLRKKGVKILSADSLDTNSKIFVISKKALEATRRTQFDFYSTFAPLIVANNTMADALFLTYTLSMDRQIVASGEYKYSTTKVSFGGGIK